MRASKRTGIAVALSVAALVAAGGVIWSRSAGTLGQAAAATTDGADGERPSRAAIDSLGGTVPSPTGAANVNAAGLGAAGRGSSDTVDSAQEPVPVAVEAAQVLARVNGVAITGADLLAFRASDPAKQTMTPQMFEFLLERAIDRELVAHEARTRRVELTSEQEAQLVAVREQAVERGVTDSSELALEQRDARAELLQTALLTRQGAAAPPPGDAEVQRYYDAHRDAFEPLPEPSAARAAAWQKVQLQIRQRLATESQGAYRQQLRAYLDGLRKAARVTRGAQGS